MGRGLHLLAIVAVTIGLGGCPLPNEQPQHAVPGAGGTGAPSNDGGDGTAGSGGQDGLACPITLTPLGPASSSTAHVRIYFTATDVEGRPVEGLADMYGQDPNLFVKREDDQPIDVFESDFVVNSGGANLRVPTVLVLDLSRSVVDGGGLDKLKSSANSIIDSLTDPQELAILTFADSVTVRSNFTSDKTVLKSAIDSITGEDGVSTNLYGALEQGFGMWEDGFVEGTPVVPVSCVPGLSCDGYSDCNEACAAQMSASGPTCEDWCMDTYGTSCNDACVANGMASCDDMCTAADQEACDPTYQCSVPSNDSLTAGLLIAISDGNDTAALSTLDAVKAAQQSKRAVFVPVGSEIDVDIAASIAGANVFQTSNYAELESKITDLIDLVSQLNKAIYIAEYCSPKLAGTHELFFTLQCNLEHIGSTASCAPTGLGPNCNGTGIYCGENGTSYVCCDPGFPYHCPGSCYTTAEAAQADCGSTCGACGVDDSGNNAEGGLAITVSFSADSFDTKQCADL